jgi:hypothetical protein
MSIVGRGVGIDNGNPSLFGLGRLTSLVPILDALNLYVYAPFTSLSANLVHTSAAVRLSEVWNSTMATLSALFTGWLSAAEPQSSTLASPMSARVESSLHTLPPSSEVPR